MKIADASFKYKVLQLKQFTCKVLTYLSVSSKIYSSNKAWICFTGTLIVVLTKGKNYKSFGLTISGKLTLSLKILWWSQRIWPFFNIINDRADINFEIFSIGSFLFYIHFEIIFTNNLIVIIKISENALICLQKHLRSSAFCLISLVLLPVPNFCSSQGFY